MADQLDPLAAFAEGTPDPAAAAALRSADPADVLDLIKILDADKMRAEYRDGILALFIPRAESDKPKAISIN